MRGRFIAKLERELHDAIHAFAREDRLLHDHLALGALEHAAADRRVFALGILAHHVVIDVADLASDQRTGDARHQTHRAQIHVLIEHAAET